LEQRELAAKNPKIINRSAAGEGFCRGFQKNHSIPTIGEFFESFLQEMPK
jgi:hypothetical protein